MGIRGDVNLDGKVSILDVIKLLRIIVGKDSAPAAGSTAFKIADANADSSIDITNLITQVNQILGISPYLIAKGPSAPVLCKVAVCPCSNSPL